MEHEDKNDEVEDIRRIIRRDQEGSGDHQSSIEVWMRVLRDVEEIWRGRTDGVLDWVIDRDLEGLWISGDVRKFLHGGIGMERTGEYLSKYRGA